MHVKMDIGDSLSVQFAHTDGGREVRIDYLRNGLRIQADTPDSSDRVGTIYHEDPGPLGYSTADPADLPQTMNLPHTVGPVSHKAMTHMIDYLARSDDEGGPTIRIMPVRTRAAKFGGPDPVTNAGTYFITVEDTTVDAEGYNRDRYALRAAYARCKHL